MIRHYLCAWLYRWVLISNLCAPIVFSPFLSRQKPGRAPLRRRPPHRRPQHTKPRWASTGRCSRWSCTTSSDFQVRCLSDNIIFFCVSVYVYSSLSLSVYLSIYLFVCLSPLSLFFSSPLSTLLLSIPLPLPLINMLQLLFDEYITASLTIISTCISHLLCYYYHCICLAGVGPLMPFLPVIVRQKGIPVHYVGAIWTVLSMVR